MLCSHYKQYYSVSCSGCNCFCRAMKCRPLVHARFTAVSWLVALVYRGVINDVTLWYSQSGLRSLTRVNELGIFEFLRYYTLALAVASTLSGPGALSLGSPNLGFICGKSTQVNWEIPRCCHWHLN